MGVLVWPGGPIQQGCGLCLLMNKEGTAEILWAICTNMVGTTCKTLLIMMSSRGVTIQVSHDTIRISIQRSRYNTYFDTYLNTVRCQRDVMSSMKAETLVIRSPTHNLLLQWMEYLLLQLPMLSQDVTLLSYTHVILEYFHQSDQKKLCVSISLVQKYLCT